MGSLEYMPAAPPKLVGSLKTSFDYEERDKFNATWKPYKDYGVQPCADGVQVYTQPQSPEAIRVLAQTLLEIAGRLEEHDV
jgi:hypothetical protein